MIKHLSFFTLTVAGKEPQFIFSVQWEYQPLDYDTNVSRSYTISKTTKKLSIVRYNGISHFFFHLNEGLTFFAITYILGVYVVNFNLLTFEVILEVPFITKKNINEHILHIGIYFFF